MRTRILALCERADAAGANGLDFQHAALCPRRCWLHLHRASLNAWSETIRIGEAVHAASHTRNRSTQGLAGLRPDRVDWEARLVVEEKHSASHPEASCDQLAFYAAMLTRASGEDWAGRIYLSRSRKHPVAVVLDEGRVRRLEASMVLIETLRAARDVPPASRRSVCSGCSNEIFCWTE